MVSVIIQPLTGERPLTCGYPNARDMHQVCGATAAFALIEEDHTTDIAPQEWRCIPLCAVHLREAHLHLADEASRAQSAQGVQGTATRY